MLRLKSKQIERNADGCLSCIYHSPRNKAELYAVKLTTKRAEDVARAVIDALLDCPMSWVKRITFDNGMNFIITRQ